MVDKEGEYLRTESNPEELGQLLDQVFEGVDESYIESQDPDFSIDDAELLGSSSDAEEEFDISDSESSLSSSEVDMTSSNAKAYPSPTPEIDSLLTSHKAFKGFVRKHEVPRKIFHMSIGFVTLYLYTQNVQIDQLVAPLFTGFISVLSMDFLRFKWAYFNKLYCKSLGFLMREKEVKSYNGVCWYLLGLGLVFYNSAKDVAVVSLLLLSWSDTAASTFGRAFGKYTPKISKNKSVAGSLAALITGVLSSYLFYGYFVPQYPSVNAPGCFLWSQESSKLSLHSLSFLCGLVAAVSESIDVFGVDDNLTIPVISSVFLTKTIPFFHN